MAIKKAWSRHKKPGLTAGLRCKGKLKDEVTGSVIQALHRFLVNLAAFTFANGQNGHNHDIILYFVNQPVARLTQLNFVEIIGPG